MGPLDFLFDLKILTYSYFRGSTWVFEDLSSPYWRLYWHTHPGTWMRLHQKDISTSPGEFTLIAPYTPLKACGRTKPHHFYIHFNAGYPFNVIANKLLTYPADRKNITALQTLASTVADGSVSAADGSLTCTRIVAEALSRIPWKEWGAGSSDKRILLTDSYMSEHMNRTVSNDELANLVHMAPNAFIRFFKRMTGITPQKYFTGRKIERASFLLEYHDMSIEKIADMLGFSDRYHFSKVFKKIIGTGPAAYRKRIRRM